MFLISLIFSVLFINEEHGVLHAFLNLQVLDQLLVPVAYRVQHDNVWLRLSSVFDQVLWLTFYDLVSTCVEHFGQGLDGRRVFINHQHLLFRNALLQQLVHLVKELFGIYWFGQVPVHPDF